MATTNSLTSEVRASEVVEGVDTNADGEVDVVVGDLRQIDSPADASAQAAGGYVANVTAIDGNTVTVTLFEEDDGGEALAEVADGDDVTDIHVEAFGY